MSFEQVMATLEDIARRITMLESQMQTAEQVISEEGLSDIDSNLGLLTSGELRFGLGFPGKPSFTGIRLASEGMLYGSTDYLMASVDSDALQWGVRSSDGSFEAVRISLVDRVRLSSSDGSMNSDLYINATGELRYVDSDATDYLVGYATT